MAQITVEGYVNERRGKMLRISEQYRRKNEQGEWETTGYGNFTVWLRKEDQQPEIDAGVVVVASGRLVVSTTEKNGTVYTNLNVNADSVGMVRTTGKYRGSGQGGAGRPQTASAGDWATPAGFDAQAPAQHVQGGWDDAGSPF